MKGRQSTVTTIAILFASVSFWKLHYPMYPKFTTLEGFHRESNLLTEAFSERKYKELRFLNELIIIINSLKKTQFHVFLILSFIGKNIGGQNFRKSDLLPKILFSVKVCGK